MTAVLLALAADDETAIKLASVIALLVRRGAELGELEAYELPDPLGLDGSTLKCKRVRGEWLERLGVAVERNALASMDAERVVQILLQGRA
jgi:hypothetical protein